MKIGKTGLIIIGITSVLAIVGGIVVYFNYRSNHKNDEQDVDTNLPDETTVPSGGNIPPVVNNPLTDKLSVQKFQDWMDTKHPNWLDNGKSLKKGAGYGNFGSQTARAWNKYGSEYRNSGAFGAAILSGASSGTSSGIKIKPTDTNTSKDLELGMKGKRVLLFQFIMNFIYGTKIPLNGIYDIRLKNALKTNFHYILGNSINRKDELKLKDMAVKKAGSFAGLMSKATSDRNFVNSSNLYL